MKSEYSRIPIGNLVEQVKKWNPQTDKDNQVITYLDIASVNRESKKVEESIEIQSHEAPSRARQLVRKDDVLVSTVRPNLNAVAYLEEEFDGATASTGFCVLRAKSDKLDSRYLYYWVRTTYFIDDMVRESTGASYPAVSDSIVKKNEIPLPPLEEQKRIAAILDKADRIRRRRQEAIRLTEELGRSIFLDMFGDPVTNPKGWEVVKLENLLDFMTSGSRGWAKYYTEKGKIFLRIQNVKNGQLILEDVAFVDPPNNAEGMRTRVKEGDVLVSITADLGRTAVIPKNMEEAYINQHLVILRLKQDRLSPTYLSSFISSEGGQRQLSKLDREGVKSGLNFSDLKGLSIVFPPMKEQRKYEKTYTMQLNQLSNQKRALEESENLFNSLLQRAFRGEL